MGSVTETFRIAQMNMAEVQAELAELNRVKGFGMTSEPGVFEILAHLQLVSGELSEAAEDVRHGRMGVTYREDGKPEGFPTELADAVIRLFNMADDMGIDLQEVVAIKTAYNRTRSYRHGGKRA